MTRLLLAALLLSLPVGAFAQVPETMTYQGRVTTASGGLLGASPTPVNRMVTFRIWTSASGGTRMHSEQQVVTIANGEFSVLLGTGTAVVDETKVVPFSAVFDGTGDRFLGVTVDDGITNNTDPEIAPRQRMVTSAYAFRAKVADQVKNMGVTADMIGNGQVGTDQIAAGSVTASKFATSLPIAFSGSKVGIGVATPLAGFQVGATPFDFAPYTPAYGSPAMFVSPTTSVPAGGGTPRAPEPALMLVRPGVAGHVHSSYARFDLSRWSSGNGGPSTQLDFRLGDVNNPEVDGNNTRTVMSLRSDGNVGVGTLVPASRLDVNNTAAWHAMAVRGSGGTDTLLAGNFGARATLGAHNGTLSAWASLVLNGDFAGANNAPSGGSDVLIPKRLGVGTHVPQARLHVGIKPYDFDLFTPASATPAMFVTASANQVGGVIRAPEPALILARDGTLGESHSSFARFDISRYATGNSGPSTQLDFRLGDFNNPAAEQDATPTVMSLRSNGYVGIGTKAPAKNLEVVGEFRLTALFNHYWDLRTGNITGDAGLYFKSLHGTHTRLRHNDGGWDQVSDRRLKTEIAPLGNTLDRLIQLKPVSYRFIAAPEAKRKSIGFIAQEVEPLFPDLVGEIEGNKSVSYTEFIPIIVAAVQEVGAKVDALTASEARNAALDLRVRDLEAKVASMDAWKAAFEKQFAALAAVKNPAPTAGNSQ